MPAALPLERSPWESLDRRSLDVLKTRPDVLEKINISGLL